MASNSSVLYRPPENHIGVVYRFGRFNRFVDPDQFTLLFPPFDQVRLETRLDMRTALIALEDVYTHENIPVNVNFKVFFQVDLRRVEPERLVQVLRFPTENAWEEIVRTAVNDIVRNMVFLAHTFTELNTQAGRAFLKHTLSGEVASRVRSFGILINPRFGVNLSDLQPNAEFREALMQASAAETLGGAALARIRPLVKNIYEYNQESAVITLLMNIASAIARNGTVPDVVLSNPNENLNGGIIRGDGGKGGSSLPNIPGFTNPNRKPKSLAGD